MSVHPVAIGLSLEAGCCCPSAAENDTVMRVYKTSSKTWIAPSDFCGLLCSCSCIEKPHQAIDLYKQRFTQLGVEGQERSLITKLAAIDIQQMNSSYDYLTVKQVKQLEQARVQARMIMDQVATNLLRSAYRELMTATEAEFQTAKERSSHATPYNPEALKVTLALIADYTPGQLDAVMADIGAQIRALRLNADETIRFQDGELEKMVIVAFNRARVTVLPPDHEMRLGPGNCFKSYGTLLNMLFPDADTLHRYYLYPPTPASPKVATASMTRS